MYLTNIPEAQWLIVLVASFLTLVRDVARFIVWLGVRLGDK